MSLSMPSRSFQVIVFLVFSICFHLISAATPNTPTTIIDKKGMHCWPMFVIHNGYLFVQKGLSL